MIPFGREFLVSDTVPFLSKKPHIYLPHRVVVVFFIENESTGIGAMSSLR